MKAYYLKLNLFCGVGTIRISKYKNISTYTVYNKNDINNVIIPHFV